MRVRRRCVAGIIGLVLLLGLGWAYAAEVTIPDANLEAAIRDALDKPEGPLTEVDLASLTWYLDVWNQGITDLTGLEYCVNLKWLVLNGNRISNVGPLSGLSNLTSLSLDNNSISDIAPLAGLTNLTTLDLNANQLSNVGPLSGLSNLTSLSLNSNSISDIAPLAGLTNLTTLDLNANQLSNLDPLSGLVGLTTLSLNNNAIQDLTPLRNLTHLGEVYGRTSHLDLSNNPISDIASLAANSGLDKGDIIDLTGCPLSEDSLTKHVPVLLERGVKLVGVTSQEVSIPDPNLEAVIREALDKPEGPLTDIDLARLSMISALNRGIADLTGLEYCVNLGLLDVSGNQISDLSPLTELTDLWVLSFSNNQIASIAPLSGLEQLAMLYLDHNQIGDLSPLASLTHLGDLTLTDKFLLTAAGVRREIDGIGLDLDIANNPVTDIGPLVSNMGLDEQDGINLRGCPLSQESLSVHIPALLARGVRVVDLSPLWGDVSSDDQLDAQDASLVLQHVVQRVTLSESQRLLGDVSGDGTLTSYDAALILMKLAGIIGQFPVE